MTTVRWTRLLGACAALILVATACGDDGTTVAAETADTPDTAEGNAPSTGTAVDTSGGIDTATATRDAAAIGDTAAEVANDPDQTDDAGESDERDDIGTTSAEAEDAGADGVIDVDFVGGEVEIADDRITVPLGTAVTLSVTSDVTDHVHLHGYDLFVDVGPDAPASLTFTADVPGLFEIEFEDSSTFIVELEVR